MIYRTKDGQEYERYTKFSHYQSPLITWIPLLVSENRVKYFDQSHLVEVKSPFDSGMVYDQPQPAPITYTCEPPPLTLLQRDYLDAMTEVFNTRNTERQKSRDLYITELYDAIADELEAA